MKLITLIKYLSLLLSVGVADAEAISIGSKHVAPVLDLYDASLTELRNGLLNNEFSCVDLVKVSFKWNTPADSVLIAASAC